MPFQYTLANLLAKNDGALAVIFLDDTGETVDLACADRAPYQMKLAGAYLGIYLRQVGATLSNSGLGEPEFIHIEREAAHFYATALPDGYYLVLVQQRPGLAAVARRSLASARDELTRELFT